MSPPLPGDAGAALAGLPSPASEDTGRLAARCGSGGARPARRPGASAQGHASFSRRRRLFSESRAQFSAGDDSERRLKLQSEKRTVGHLIEKHYISASLARRIQASSYA